MSYTVEVNGFQQPVYDQIMKATVEINVLVNGIERPEISKKLMRNGAVMGFVCENIGGEIYSSTHEHSPAKGYDLKSIVPELLNLESKSATRHGAKLGPSDMYGAKRKYDHERFIAETKVKDFIIFDTDHLAQTGTLRWVVKDGAAVAELGHSLTRKKCDALFSE